jgi:hypothetical protein
MFLDLISTKGPQGRERNEEKNPKNQRNQDTDFVRAFSAN